MTDLQKITTEVKPTSLSDNIEPSTEAKYEATIKDLLKSLKVYDDNYRAFDEGLFSEKNKLNTFTKILIDLISYIFEQDDIKIENPNELLLHKQNKKFIKEALVMLLSNVKNYNIDDKKAKLMLTGKLIQSLYESKS